MTLPMGQRHAVIADDHAVVRDGLRAILEEIDDVEIVGEAENGLEAISLSKELQPTLLTLDAGMPLAKGMEVFVEVRRWSPETRIIVITGFNAKGHLADWIAAGVDGMLLKSTTPDEMRKGFQVVLGGGSYVAHEVLAILEEHSEVPPLTARERQVLHLIADGCNNAEIAKRLSVSAKTVDNHRTRLMAKLDVHSVAQLIAYALKEGLLDQTRQL